MAASGSSYWDALAGRRWNRRRLLAGGSALSGLAALALTGCSSSNNGNSNKTGNTTGATSNAPAASSAATAARTSTPASSSNAQVAAVLPTANPSLKTGGTINFVIVGDAPLDPVANTTYRAQDLAGFHYAKLVRFLGSTDPNTSLSKIIVPDLAEKWEISPDALQYTFHLRQDVTFHPPLSRPLTSADILASWQYFTTNPKNPNNNVFADFTDSVTAPDANTVVFKLTHPYAPFLNKLANPSYMWIMSADAVNGKIDPATQAIGTGPWIYQDQTPNAITWKKNPSYWNKGLPYADGAAINKIASTANQEAQFKAGALDVLNIATADLDPLKKDNPKASFIEYANAGLMFYFFYDVNAADSPFKDVRVRQAASLALDRKSLIDATVNGHGFYCNMVPAGLGKWYLDPNGSEIGDTGRLFKFNTQQAKQMLQAAGATGTQIVLYYPNNAYGDVFNQQVDLARGMLADAGFNLQVVPVDYLTQWIDTSKGYWVKGLPKNGLGHALQTGFSDPDDYLTGMLVKGGNRNDSLVDDADLAQLIKAQQVELDEDKRVQLVHQATKAADEKMYYVPMIYTNTITAVQPWVQNFFPVDSYNFGTESFPFASVNNK